MERLGCHLADAFTCDKAEAFVLFCYGLRYAHHISPHDDCKLFMGTFFIYSHLDLGKVYDVQGDRAGVFGNNPCKVDDLLFCPFAGIGRRVEICCVYLTAALCHHISGNGTVDTAGKKEHQLARRSDRHTSGTGHDLCVKIDEAVPYLDVYGYLRLVHIDVHIRESVKDLFAKRFVYLLRCHGIALLCPSCKYLEGLVAVFSVHLFHVIRHGKRKVVKFTFF